MGASLAERYRPSRCSGRKTSRVRSDSVRATPEERKVRGSAHRARCVPDDRVTRRISWSLASKSAARRAGDRPVRALPKTTSKQQSTGTRADGNGDGNHHHTGADAGSFARSDLSLDQAIRYT